jgi:hypothetical protein
MPKVNLGCPGTRMGFIPFTLTLSIELSLSPVLVD